jgi:adaptin ear-binding coat-associated protein 1/2
MAGGGDQAPADAEPLELVLFQVAECYVYLVRLLAFA